MARSAACFATCARGREEAKVLRYGNLAGHQDVLDGVGSIISKQMGLRLGVPLAASCLQRFVEALVEVLVELAASDEQLVSIGARCAEQRHHFVIDFHS